VRATTAVAAALNLAVTAPGGPAVSMASEDGVLASSAARRAA
jgi:hypothetical protein